MYSLEIIISTITTTTKMFHSITAVETINVVINLIKCCQHFFIFYFKSKIKMSWEKWRQMSIHHIEWHRFMSIESIITSTNNAHRILPSSRKSSSSSWDNSSFCFSPSNNVLLTWSKVSFSAAIISSKRAPITSAHCMVSRLY